MKKDRSRQDAGAPGIEPSTILRKDRSRQDAGAPGIQYNTNSLVRLWADGTSALP
ncbi:MAG: hypothetical protein K2X77_21520 [Candidatus Obscuribacterales bacterium]|nr:hypothetical protein [Candidatus Obscuribacterales bacterium]